MDWHTGRYDNYNNKNKKFCDEEIIKVLGCFMLLPYYSSGLRIIKVLGGSELKSLQKILDFFVLIY